MKIKFLEGILPRLGFEEHQFKIKHHRGKEEFAKEIAPFISLKEQNLEQANRSHSFHIFLKTLHSASNCKY